MSSSVPSHTVEQRPLSNNTISLDQQSSAVNCDPLPDDGKERVGPKECMAMAGLTTTTKTSHEESHVEPSTRASHGISELKVVQSDVHPKQTHPHRPSPPSTTNSALGSSEGATIFSTAPVQLTATPTCSKEALDGSVAPEKNLREALPLGLPHVTNAEGGLPTTIARTETPNVGRNSFTTTALDQQWRPQGVPFPRATGSSDTVTPNHYSKTCSPSALYSPEESERRTQAAAAAETTLSSPHRCLEEELLAVHDSQPPIRDTADENEGPMSSRTPVRTASREDEKGNSLDERPPGRHAPITAPGAGTGGSWEVSGGGVGWSPNSSSEGQRPGSSSPGGRSYTAFQDHSTKVSGGSSAPYDLDRRVGGPPPHRTGDTAGIVLTHQETRGGGGGVESCRPSIAIRSKRLTTRRASALVNSAALSRRGPHLRSCHPHRTTLPISTNPAQQTGRPPSPSFVSEAPPPQQTTAAEGGERCDPSARTPGRRATRPPDGGCVSYVEGSAHLSERWRAGEESAAQPTPPLQASPEPHPTLKATASPAVQHSPRSPLRSFLQETEENPPPEPSSVETEKEPESCHLPRTNFIRNDDADANEEGKEEMNSVLPPPRQTATSHPEKEGSEAAPSARPFDASLFTIKTSAQRQHRPQEPLGEGAMKPQGVPSRTPATPSSRVPPTSCGSSFFALVNSGLGNTVTPLSDRSAASEGAILLYSDHLTHSSPQQSPVEDVCAMDALASSAPQDDHLSSVPEVTSSVLRPSTAQEMPLSRHRAGCKAPFLQDASHGNRRSRLPNSLSVRTQMQEDGRSALLREYTQSQRWRRVSMQLQLPASSFTAEDIEGTAANPPAAKRRPSTSSMLSGASSPLLPPYPVVCLDTTPPSDRQLCSLLISPSSTGASSAGLPLAARTSRRDGNTNASSERWQYSMRSLFTPIKEMPLPFAEGDTAAAGHYHSNDSPTTNVSSSTSAATRIHSVPPFGLSFCGGAVSISTPHPRRTTTAESAVRRRRWSFVVLHTNTRPATRRNSNRLTGCPSHEGVIVRRRSSRGTRSSSGDRLARRRAHQAAPRSSRRRHRSHPQQLDFLERHLSSGAFHEEGEKSTAEEEEVSRPVGVPPSTCGSSPTPSPRSSRLQCTSGDRAGSSNRNMPPCSLAQRSEDLYPVLAHLQTEDEEKDEVVSPSKQQQGCNAARDPRPASATNTLHTERLRHHTSAVWGEKEKRGVRNARPPPLSYAPLDKKGVEGKTGEDTDVEEEDGDTFNSISGIPQRFVPPDRTAIAPFSTRTSVPRVFSAPPHTTVPKKESAVEKEGEGGPTTTTTAPRGAPTATQQEQKADSMTATPTSLTKEASQDGYRVEKGAGTPSSTLASSSLVRFERIVREDAKNNRVSQEGLPNNAFQLPLTPMSVDEWNGTPLSPPFASFPTYAGSSFTNGATRFAEDGRQGRGDDAEGGERMSGHSPSTLGPEQPPSGSARESRKCLASLRNSNSSRVASVSPSTFPFGGFGVGWLSFASVDSTLSAQQCPAPHDRPFLPSTTTPEGTAAAAGDAHRHTASSPPRHVFGPSSQEVASSHWEAALQSPSHIAPESVSLISSPGAVGTRREASPFPHHPAAGLWGPPFLPISMGSVNATSTRHLQGGILHNSGARNHPSSTNNTGNARDPLTPLLGRGVGGAHGSSSPSRTRPTAIVMQLPPSQHGHPPQQRHPLSFWHPPTTPSAPPLRRRAGSGTPSVGQQVPNGAAALLTSATGPHPCAGGLSHHPPPSPQHRGGSVSVSSQPASINHRASSSPAFEAKFHPASTAAYLSSLHTTFSESGSGSSASPPSAPRGSQHTSFFAGKFHQLTFMPSAGGPSAASSAAGSSQAMTTDPMFAVTCNSLPAFCGVHPLRAQSTAGWLPSVGFYEDLSRAGSTRDLRRERKRTRQHRGQRRRRTHPSKWHARQRAAGAKATQGHACDCGCGVGPDCSCASSCTCSCCGSRTASSSVWWLNHSAAWESSHTTTIASVSYTTYSTWTLTSSEWNGSHRNEPSPPPPGRQRYASMQGGARSYKRKGVKPEVYRLNEERETPSCWWAETDVENEDDWMWQHKQARRNPPTRTRPALPSHHSLTSLSSKRNVEREGEQSRPMAEAVVSPSPPTPSRNVVDLVDVQAKLSEETQEAAEEGGGEDEWSVGREASVRTAPSLVLHWRKQDPQASPPPPPPAAAAGAAHSAFSTSSVLLSGSFSMPCAQRSPIGAATTTTSWSGEAAAGRRGAAALQHPRETLRDSGGGECSTPRHKTHPLASFSPVHRHCPSDSPVPPPHTVEGPTNAAVSAASKPPVCSVSDGQSFQQQTHHSTSESESGRLGFPFHEDLCTTHHHPQRRQEVEHSHSILHCSPPHSQSIPSHPHRRTERERTTDNPEQRSSLRTAKKHKCHHRHPVNQEHSTSQTSFHVQRRRLDRSLVPVGSLNLSRGFLTSVNAGSIGFEGALQQQAGTKSSPSVQLEQNNPLSTANGAAAQPSSSPVQLRGPSIFSGTPSFETPQWSPMPLWDVQHSPQLIPDAFRTSASRFHYRPALSFSPIALASPVAPQVGVTFSEPSPAPLLPSTTGGEVGHRISDNGGGGGGSGVCALLPWPHSTSSSGTLPVSSASFHRVSPSLMSFSNYATSLISGAGLVSLPASPHTGTGALIKATQTASTMSTKQRLETPASPFVPFALTSAAGLGAPTSTLTPTSSPKHVLTTREVQQLSPPFGRPTTVLSGVKKTSFSGRGGASALATHNGAEEASETSGNDNGVCAAAKKNYKNRTQQAQSSETPRECFSPLIPFTWTVESSLSLSGHSPFRFQIAHTLAAPTGAVSDSSPPSPLMQDSSNSPNQASSSFHSTQMNSPILFAQARTPKRHETSFSMPQNSSGDPHNVGKEGVGSAGLFTKQNGTESVPHRTSPWIKVGRLGSPPPAAVDVAAFANDIKRSSFATSFGSAVARKDMSDTGEPHPLPVEVPPMKPPAEGNTAVHLSQPLSRVRPPSPRLSSGICTARDGVVGMSPLHFHGLEVVDTPPIATSSSPSVAVGRWTNNSSPQSPARPVLSKCSLVQSASLAAPPCWAAHSATTSTKRTISILHAGSKSLQSLSNSLGVSAGPSFPPSTTPATASPHPPPGLLRLGSFSKPPLSPSRQSRGATAGLLGMPSPSRFAVSLHPQREGVRGLSSQPQPMDLHRPSTGPPTWRTPTPTKPGRLAEGGGRRRTNAHARSANSLLVCHATASPPPSQVLPIGPCVFHSRAVSAPLLRTARGESTAAAGGEASENLTPPPPRASSALGLPQSASPRRAAAAQGQRRLSGPALTLAEMKTQWRAASALATEQKRKEVEQSKKRKEARVRRRAVQREARRRQRRRRSSLYDLRTLSTSSVLYYNDVDEKAVRVVTRRLLRYLIMDANEAAHHRSTHKNPHCSPTPSASQSMSSLQVMNNTTRPNASALVSLPAVATLTNEWLFSTVVRQRRAKRCEEECRRVTDSAPHPASSESFSGVFSAPLPTLTSPLVPCSSRSPRAGSTAKSLHADRPATRSWTGWGAGHPVRGKSTLPPPLLYPRSWDYATGGGGRREDDDDTEGQHCLASNALHRPFESACGYPTVSGATLLHPRPPPTSRSVEYQQLRLPSTYTAPFSGEALPSRKRLLFPLSRQDDAPQEVITSKKKQMNHKETNDLLFVCSAPAPSSFSAREHRPLVDFTEGDALPAVTTSSSTFYSRSLEHLSGHRPCGDPSSSGLGLPVPRCTKCHKRCHAPSPSRALHSEEWAPTVSEKPTPRDGASRKSGLPRTPRLWSWTTTSGTVDPLSLPVPLSSVSSRSPVRAVLRSFEGRAARPPSRHSPFTARSEPVGRSSVGVRHHSGSTRATVSLASSSCHCVRGALPSLDSFRPDEMPRLAGVTPKSGETFDPERCQRLADEERQRSTFPSPQGHRTASAHSQRKEHPFSTLRSASSSVKREEDEEEGASGTLDGSSFTSFSSSLLAPPPTEKEYVAAALELYQQFCQRAASPGVRERDDPSASISLTRCPRVHQQRQSGVCSTNPQQRSSVTPVTATPASSKSCSEPTLTPDRRRSQVKDPKKHGTENPHTAFKKSLRDVTMQQKARACANDGKVLNSLFFIFPAIPSNMKKAFATVVRKKSSANSVRGGGTVQRKENLKTNSPAKDHINGGSAGGGIAFRREEARDIEKSFALKREDESTSTDRDGASSRKAPHNNKREPQRSRSSSSSRQSHNPSRAEKDRRKNSRHPHPSSGQTQPELLSRTFSTPIVRMISPHPDLLASRHSSSEPLYEPLEGKVVDRDPSAGTPHEGLEVLRSLEKNPAHPFTGEAIGDCKVESSDHLLHLSCLPPRGPKHELCKARQLLSAVPSILRVPSTKSISGFGSRSLRGIGRPSHYHRRRQLHWHRSPQDRPLHRSFTSPSLKKENSSESCSSNDDVSLASAAFTPVRKSSAHANAQPMVLDDRDEEEVDSPPPPSLSPPADSLGQPHKGGVSSTTTPPARAFGTRRRTCLSWPLASDCLDRLLRYRHRQRQTETAVRSQESARRKMVQEASEQSQRRPSSILDAVAATTHTGHSVSAPKRSMEGQLDSRSCSTHESGGVGHPDDKRPYRPVQTFHYRHPHRHFLLLPDKHTQTRQEIGPDRRPAHARGDASPTSARKGSMGTPMGNLEPSLGSTREIRSPVGETKPVVVTSTTTTLFPSATPAIGVEQRLSEKFSAGGVPSKSSLVSHRNSTREPPQQQQQQRLPAAAARTSRRHHWRRGGRRCHHHQQRQTTTSAKLRTTLQLLEQLPPTVHLSDYLEPCTCAEPYSGQKSELHPMMLLRATGSSMIPQQLSTCPEPERHRVSQQPAPRQGGVPVPHPPVHQLAALAALSLTTAESTTTTSSSSSSALHRVSVSYQ